MIHKHLPLDEVRLPLLRRRSFVVLLLAIPGCISPLYTRVPVPQAANPSSESRAFQQQDPFPDPDIGPDIHARPRGFLRPRTESRRAAELRLLQGIPSGPEYVPPGNPQGGLSRPSATY